MHEGEYEDGRITHCWGCGIEHYTSEAMPRRETHWLDLCSTCIPEYFEGRERGARDQKNGSICHNRDAMTTVTREGYVAGAFLFKIKGHYNPRGGSATERLLSDSVVT